MTTQAPASTQADGQPQLVDIGAEILKRSGVTAEDLGSLPQTETYVDLRGSTWMTNRGVPIASFAGHTVIFIAAPDDDNDVRIYGAPVPRPNMSASEQKALREKAGVFVIWTLNRVAPSMLLKSVQDPNSFAEAVAKEIRNDYDTFTENDDEIDDAIEYLEELQKKGGSLQQGIEGLKAGAHQEEDEEEAPPAAPNPS